jgi:methionyl-tRNA synthetase
VTRARGFGVPVPNDTDQIMYVWFDALSIYLTAIGWGIPGQAADFAKFWPANAHFIGKGINRFHSIYWIGMLLSADLPLPKAISVHGYLTADGQKMSKSLGNVIDPFELVKKYGLEPVRYYLLKEIPTHVDGDFSAERFRDIYTADLANGLGNLCSRIAKLIEKNGGDFRAIINNAPDWSDETVNADQLLGNINRDLDNFELSQALTTIASALRDLDAYLTAKAPWKKTGVEQTAILRTALEQLLSIVTALQPFLPETSQRILNHFKQEKIVAISPLFPRLPEEEKNAVGSKLGKST